MDVVDQISREWTPRLQEVHEETRGVVEIVDEGLQIQGQADLEFAAELLREVKAKKRNLEDERKRATKPLNEALRVIRGWFKAPIEAYAGVEQKVKERIAAYHQAQADAQRQALEQAGRAALTGHAQQAIQGMQQAHAAQVDKVDGLSLREKWGDYQVVDISQIPRGFLAVNDRAVRQYIQEHKDRAQIPGIRVLPPRKIVASRSK